MEPGADIATESDDSNTSLRVHANAQASIAAGSVTASTHLAPATDVSGTSEAEVIILDDTDDVAETQRHQPQLSSNPVMRLESGPMAADDELRSASPKPGRRMAAALNANRKQIVAAQTGRNDEVPLVKADPEAIATRDTVIDLTDDTDIQIKTEPGIKIERNAANAADPRGHRTEATANASQNESQAAKRSRLEDMERELREIELRKGVKQLRAELGMAP